MEKAINVTLQLLQVMQQYKASDLFVSAGLPPAVKVNGQLLPLSEQKLSADNTLAMGMALMNSHQQQVFTAHKELNFSMEKPGFGRFRVNVFMQQGSVGLVFRNTGFDIPKLEDLGLHSSVRDVAMAKNGLVLIAGAAGSGKSTTLAAMIDYRNTHSQGHIVTVEDPIEFMHTPKQCLVIQREIGTDTSSWKSALTNAMRQAPDVLMIGEILDREAMEQAITHAQTGHLVLATLHANNANQAINRVLTFYSEAHYNQVLIDLSLNLRACISQRLVPRFDSEGRVLVQEILYQSSFASKLIEKGNITALKDLMAKSNEVGMQTFDQHLFQLYRSGVISLDSTIAFADSADDMRLMIKLNRSIDVDADRVDTDAAEITINMD